MKKSYKLFGYGIIIWAVAYLVATIFVVLNIQNTFIAWLVTAVVTLAVTFLLARSLNISIMKEIIKYAVVWTATGLILDALITTHFTGWEFFAKWNIWVSYALGFLAVLFAAKTQRKTA